MGGGRYACWASSASRSPLPAAEASVRASELGFEFIDPLVGTDPSTLKLPVGCPASDPTPVPGWGSAPAPVGRTRSLGGHGGAVPPPPVA